MDYIWIMEKMETSCIHGEYALYVVMEQKVETSESPATLREQGMLTELSLTCTCSRWASCKTSFTSHNSQTYLPACLALEVQGVGLGFGLRWVQKF